MNVIGVNMGKESKKLVRAAFRKAVFTRDGYKCRICTKPGADRQSGVTPHKGEVVDLDAHHICDRHLLPHGGYVLENGISVCSDCHLKAESHWADGATPEPGFSPAELYQLIGSSYDEAWAASEERLGDG
jgi:5-methylcytosine-specific restriction endonuclease McrA